MMKVFHSANEKYSVIFLSVTFLVGTILHMIPEVRPMVTKLTELYLLLVNILVFSFGIMDNQRNIQGYVFWTVIATLVVFSLAVVGVETGVVFGSFWYGETMPTRINGVPAIIGLNWSMLMLSSYGFLSGLVKNKLLRVILASALLVLLDIFIEPAAMKLDYWNWENAWIPLKNYVGWFFISLVFNGIYASMKLHAHSIFFKFYLIWQFIFFIALNIAK